jgi:excisionase family DNA binding protein
VVRKVQPLPAEDRLLTPAEAAAELGIGVQALRRREAAGKIAPLRTIGGHRRYRAADVAKLKRKRARKARAA